MKPGMGMPMAPGQQKKMIPRQPPRVVMPPGQQKKMVPGQPPRVVMPPGQQKKMVPGQPPRVVMLPGQQKKMVPGQPPRVVMPPGQHKKMVPGQPPKVAPRGPQNNPIVPPKSVLPKKGFRTRPQQSSYDRRYETNEYYSNYNNQNGYILCPDCQRKEEAFRTYQQRDNKSNVRGKSENRFMTYNNKNYQRISNDANLDNYKYHEINETTEKNKISHFVVKKGDVIISSTK